MKVIMILEPGNLLEAPANITKMKILLIIIFIALIVVWIFLPEISVEQSDPCWQPIGNIITYRVFNKIEFWTFMICGFFFVPLVKGKKYISILIIMLILATFLLANIYVYRCSHQ